MKKNAKKLHLYRDTLVLLDPKAASAALGRAAVIDTSCTYACACPTGCSEEQACLEAGVLAR